MHELQCLDYFLRKMVSAIPHLKLFVSAVQKLKTNMLKLEVGSRMRLSHF